MDQLKSSSGTVAMPKRSFSVEFIVGIFTTLTLAGAGYLAVGLGDVRLFGSSMYVVNAEFDNVSGLKAGAAVEVAGVPVGEVAEIKLKDPRAIVVMHLVKDFHIRDDDVAMIRTKGIIGDRYVKLSRGASDTFIKENGTMTETESVVDIEDIIGKIVHSLTGDKDDKEEKSK